MYPSEMRHIVSSSMECQHMIAQDNNFSIDSLYLIIICDVTEIIGR